MTAATIQDAGSLLVTFVLSGWLLGLAVIPERLGSATRTWLSLALAVSATVIVALPAVLAHRLAADAVVVGIVVLAMIAAVRVWDWRRRHPAVAVEGARRRFQRRRAWRWLAVMAAGALGFVTVVLPQLGVANASGLPLGTTVWYYIALASDMVAANGIPASIGEWGSQRAYPIEYLATTIHTAATATLAGGVDLGFIELYRVAVLVIAAFAAYALWRRWLPGWWAWIAAILTVDATRLSSRLVGYRPETFGLVLVLWSAWLLDEAIERRSLRWGALAGLVSGIAFHAHAEVWLLTGPLWGGIVAARVVLAWWHSSARTGSTAAVAPPTDGPPAAQPTVAPEAVALTADDPPPAPQPTQPTRRTRPSGRSRPALRALSVFLAAALTFVGIVAIAAASGTGARLADITSRTASDELRQRYGDPTWAFFAAINGFDGVAYPAPETFWDPYLQDIATTDPFAQVDLLDPVWLALTLAAAAVLLLGLRRRDARLQRFTLAWLLFAIGVFVGAFLIWRLYDTYVPQRAGPRRILPFYTIAFAGLYAAAAWVLVDRAIGVARRLLARSGRRPPRRQVAVARAAAALVVGAILAFVVQPTRDSLNIGGRALGTEGYAAMIWMHDNLPHDKVVMVNTYTDGSIGAITGMIGWTDGRAPYLEDPAWLGQAITRVQDAASFYYDPVFYGPPAGVDYVLAGREEDLAGYANFEVYWDGFASTDRLRVVKSFRDNALVLYEVIPEAGAQ